MTRTRWPALLVLLFPGVAQAQFLLPFGGGFEIGFSKVKRHGGISFSLSRGYGGFYGNPYCAPVPYAGIAVTQIRILTPPPIIVQAPPVEVLAPSTVQLPSYDEVMARAPEPQLPGREAGRFRPLEPDNRERARQPLKPEAPPDRPPPKEPPPKEPPPKEPPQQKPRLPRVPLPHADPRVESGRQVDLGKDAFSRGEYGRAAERFRQAADLAPDEPLPLFLLAQAHVALGNYRRAFDAIRDGLALKPDWPAERFRPAELYGDNVAEYGAHLAALEDALAAHPTDALLLFLCGYELWFDGRKAEARELLVRAAPALPDPGVVERFLRALPGAPAI
jgi:hypothetical protein